MSTIVNVAKVAVLRGPRDLVFEERPLPELDARSIRGETLSSALSVGTERAAFVGDPPLRPGPVYPRVVGYCNVARVSAVGSDVKSVRVGDRILTHQSHRAAFVCPETDVLAVVPKELESRRASVTYLGHLGLVALHATRVRKGETVAVLGLGVLGLSTVAIARALGADVLAVGNDSSRVAIARRIGADEPRENDAVADIVVTTVNSWAGWENALRLTRKYGRIAVLGFPGREEGPPSINPLMSRYFYDKQLTIVGAGEVHPNGDGRSEREVSTSNIAWLMERMVAGALPLDALVTHEEPWWRLKQLYELAASHDKALITAVLDWTRSQ